MRTAGQWRRNWAAVLAGWHWRWLAPGLLLALLAAIYLPRQTRDLPIGVLDLDGSALSRQLGRALDATPGMAVVAALENREAGLDQLRRGELQGFAELPGGLSTDVKAGKQATVGFYRNQANLVVGNVLLRDATAAVRTLSLGIAARRQAAAGAGASALERVQPLRLDTRSLHNPSTDYEFFLVPGVLGAVLFVLALLDGSGCAAPLRAASGGPWARLALVLAPRLAGHGLLAALVWWAILPWAGVAPLAPVWLLAGWTLGLQAVALLVGTALSLLASSELAATQAAVFLGTPAFLFSGWTWPLEAMPATHQLFARLLPTTAWLEGLLALYQKGTAVQGPGRSALWLAAFALAALGACRAGLARGSRP